MGLAPSTTGSSAGGPPPAIATAMGEEGAFLERDFVVQVVAEFFARRGALLPGAGA